MSRDADDQLKASILVVDDNRANMLALEGALEPLGQEIVLASSGEQALKLLLSRKFAVILLDVHRPGLDGYQMAALIRQREETRDVPIIFQTALYEDPAFEKRAYQLGAVDYVTKPFDIDTLRSKIDVLSSLYRRARLAERVYTAENNRLKDMFIGILGHDLRNPLGALLMAADVLLRSPGLSQSQQENVRRIERSGQRMRRLIADMIDFTRGHLGGGIPIERTRCDIADLCRQIVDECRTGHPEREVAFEVRGPLVGSWDADRIVQAISNLVANAIQYSDRDPIKLRAFADARFVSVEVRNYGPPIPEHLRATIFEPFRHGEGKVKGLGLGLYIVREIVKAHGGSVTFSSTSQGETMFALRLPSLTATGLVARWLGRER